MNIAVAERAVERYYATITRHQLDDALSAPDSIDTDIDTVLAPAQIYERCTADERRLLNHTLFHRLYLADNHITGHDEPPATSTRHTSPTSHNT